MRNLLTVTFLTLTTTLFGQFKFYRTDSIVVKNGSDTLDYAWAGGMNYCQFSTIDLDFDGKKDLFAFDRTFNQPLTFINKGGTGQIKYKYSPAYETKFPPLMSWVLLRDYNCDGKEDIFTYSPGGIAIYKNTSTPTELQFELVTTLLRGLQCVNNVNIYVSAVDIPSIEDIDNDGDLDILTFGVFGTFVEYHKNFSVEMGYGCDSLKFQMKNQRWGSFQEDPSFCKIYLNQPLSNCAAMGGSEMAPYNPASEGTITIYEDHTERELRHTGSTLLAIDLNGTNSKDLLISDVSCKNIVALTNSGTAPNLDSPMNAQDTLFPSYDVPVNLDLFPAAFHIDVNNDNKRDLIVAPNSGTLAENTTGNWLYLNFGTDLMPVFSHSQYGFLQNQMIETGEGALPVFFDYNDDGKKDLVVANFGNFSAGSYIPKFTLYQNTGTATNPTYVLQNPNYANIFAAIGKTGLYPTFGDLDNDGDDDMIVGDLDGNLHRFTNTAGPGSPATFTLTTPLMPDAGGTAIDVGKFATPLLVDLDRDGKLDLVVGEQNANLNYYRNTGTTAAPLFSLVTATLGGVQVNESWTPVGYSVPSIYDHAGQYVLFVGSQKGLVYQYNNIDGNLGGTFTLTDSLGYFNKVGGRVGPAVAHLNNDALPDLLVGNYRGGLGLYFGTDEGTGFTEKPNLLEGVQVYPNPGNGMFMIRTNVYGTYDYSVFDINGKILAGGKFSGSLHQVDLRSCENGIYFVRIANQENNITQKIIKCDQP